MKYLNTRDFGVKQLAPGTKSVLAAFECAVRDLVNAEALHTMDHNDASARQILDALHAYTRAKRTFIRHLLRKQGVLPPSPQGRKRTS